MKKIMIALAAALMVTACNSETKTTTTNTVEQVDNGTQTETVVVNED